MKRHNDTETSALRLAEIRRAIECLDLDPIRVKLMDCNEGASWSLDKVDEADLMYRRFLYLTAKYPDIPIVPTKVVDEMWHAHILDTEKYLNDCHEMFGYILHHFPYLGMRGKDDEENLKAAFEDSIKLHKNEFGVSATEFKHFSSVKASQSICGGNCLTNFTDSLKVRPALKARTGRISIF